MGFIKENMNTMNVYLTDLGKQKFFNGGFKDSIAYFSLQDETNYNTFSPDINKIPIYDNSVAYHFGDYVEYNTKFYKHKTAESINILPDTGTTTWEIINVFDPANINAQPISIIDHTSSPDTNKTSLDNDSGEFINKVFTQTTLRGVEYAKKIDNNTGEYTLVKIKNPLLGTKQNTVRYSVLHNPAYDSTTEINIITFTYE